MKRTNLFIFVILLVAGSFINSAQAQWQRRTGLAIGSIPSAFGGFGYIHYKAGIVWAGRDFLYNSFDSGATWTQVPKLFTAPITEINFFDDQIGVVSTSGGVYKTTNRGATWALILNRSEAYGVQFAGSADRIVAATDGNSAGFYYSTNGGTNWNYVSPGGHPHFVLAYPNGAAFAQSGSSIYATTDFGVTWQAKSGIDYDSWYLIQDSSSYIYLMNEEGHVFSDNKASFCRSNDGCASFQKMTLFTPQYYTGGVSAAKCAVYCQTIANGVVRSTNQGVSWVSIGGPNNFIDTRLVCAISSQIVIAADGAGQLWRTTNSGGVSLPDEEAQFTIGDPSPLSLSICDIAGSIPLQYHLTSSCSGYTMRVLTATVEGPNAPMFTFASPAPPFTVAGGVDGTLQVAFTAGNTPGTYSATLHITGYYQDAVGNKIPYDTTIDIRATVTPAGPDLRSSLSAILFPVHTPCDSKRDTIVTLTNNGCDTLTITSGPGICPPGFSFDSLALPLVIPPNGSVQVHFHFDPADSGKYLMNATFESESNGIKRSMQLTLTGTAQGATPQVVASNSAINFNSITRCDPSRDTVLVLTNTGCDTIRVLSGPGILGGAFTIDSLTLPIILAPGQSVQLHAHFDPSIVGNHTATARFTIGSSGGQQLINIDLSGALAGVQPQLQADKPMLDFGARSTCDPPIDSTIILRNTGCDTLVIIDGPGALPPEFLLVGLTLPITVPPDSSITLRFSFTPSGDGSFSATPLFTCERDKLKGTASFSLQGIGSEGKGILSASPQSLQFLPVAICAADSLVGVIANPGCDTLIIDDVLLSGDTDFIRSSLSLPFALAPGDTLRYYIVLQPKAKGSHTGQIVIHAHTAHRSKTPYSKQMTIFGTVTDGTKVLNASTPAIDFGTTTVCDLPDSTITLTNRGCDTLVITAADIVGSGFNLTTPLPIIIPPGGQQTLDVATTTDTAGTVPSNTGSLSFTSNADNAIAPLSLIRRYTYPRSVRIELVDRSASGPSGDRVRFDLLAIGDLAGITALDFDLSLNTDLLGFLSAESPNRITYINGHMQITGTPIVTDAESLGSISFYIYLTKDSVTNVTLSNLLVNGGDAYFTRCIASAVATDADFTYIFRCGERTLAKYLSGTQIFSIVSLHPNPAQDVVEVKLDLKIGATISISIIDAMGKKMSSEMFDCPEGTCTGLLDVSDLKSGMYYLEISDGNLQTVSPFLKVK